jgi:hypothetical protein
VEACLRFYGIRRDHFLKWQLLATSNSMISNPAFFCLSLYLMFFPMTLPAHSGPRPLIQFRNHLSQRVGLLGRVISPSQGRYLHIEQHKQNTSIHTLNIHSLSGSRTHHPSDRASEDSSCLRPRGYCDRVMFLLAVEIMRDYVPKRH